MVARTGQKKSHTGVTVATEEKPALSRLVCIMVEEGEDLNTNAK